MKHTKRIALIGGENKETFEKLLKGKGKEEVEVLFHNAKVKKSGGCKPIETMIRKSDVVFLMVEFCCHEAMKTAKKLAKQYNVPIRYIGSVGSSRAVEDALEILQAA